MSKLEKLIEKYCPNGVEYKTLGEITYYPKERISASKLKADNYVGVENLLKDKKGKVDSACVPNEGNFIEYIIGDLLIGNIRPYLKKIWLATNNGGTNGDILLIRRTESYKNRIATKFLYYLLSSDSFFQYANQHSKGGKMPRGDRSLISYYSVPVPPLPVQEEIVRILDAFTELEFALEAELEARRKQYEYYRNELLAFDKLGGGGRTGGVQFLRNLCNKYCPSGVVYKTLGKLLQENTVKTITPSLKIKRNDYNPSGLIPIISQEEEYISGYCNLMDKNIPDGKYVCFGDHSEHIKYVDFSFVQGADGLKILCFNEDKVLSKYMYYSLLHFYNKKSNYERHFKYLLETLLPVPPLPVQEEIVKILDRFDALVNDISIGLPAELSARRKQYEYYRNRLLTFERR